jgi:hypothetical protein
MRRSRLIPAALLLSSAMLLGGCSQITDLLGGGSQAVRDAGSGEVSEAGQLDVFTLSVGDCVDDTGGSEVTEVPVVPCSDPHDNEVYYDFSIPDGDGSFPGDEAIQTAADEGCYAEFASFVGIAYEESTLDYSFYLPTQDSWERGGDRIVSCIIYDGTLAKVTGTLAGAAR